MGQYIQGDLNQGVSYELGPFIQIKTPNGLCKVRKSLVSSYNKASVKKDGGIAYYISLYIHGGASFGMEYNSLSEMDEEFEKLEWQMKKEE